MSKALSGAGGSPHRYPGRGLVLCSGVLSVVLSLGLLLPAVLLLVNSHSWQRANRSVQDWMLGNHWDPEVTQHVWRGFSWLDVHHELVLGVVIICWVLHLLFSLLLLLGAMLHRRPLLLPWLCSQMILLVFMVVTFTSWTFLSFFVDLLVAIVFPVVAGLVLGLWVLMWRGVWTHYVTLQAKLGEGYAPVPRLQARPLPAIVED